MDDDKLSARLERLEPSRMRPAAHQQVRREMREALGEKRTAFPPVMAPKRLARSKLRILRRVAAALLVICVVLVGSFVAVGAVSGARLGDELDLIRNAGEPLTLADLRPPPVPDELNAAIPWIEAARRLDSDAVEDDLQRLLHSSPARAEFAVPIVARWVESNQEVLALLDEAVSRPGCRFPDDGPSFHERSGLPIFDLMGSTRLLAADARIDLLRDRGEEALSGIEKILALGRLMDAEPSLIAGLVRCSIESLALDTLRHAMKRVPTTSLRYADLLEDLNHIDALGTARRGLQGERASIHAIHEEFRRAPDRRAKLLDIPEGSLLRIPVRWIPDGVLRLDQARTLEAFRWMLEATALSPHEARATWSELDSMHLDLPWYAFLSRNQGSLRVTTILENFHEHQSRVDLARIAIALRLHQATHGELPERLHDIDDDLLPSIPTDPWSGEDYRYSPTRFGKFLLYGVGRDGRDDEAYPGRDLVWDIFSE